MTAAEHIAAAERCADVARDTSSVEVATVWSQMATAHALIAQALQEQQRQINEGLDRKFSEGSLPTWQEDSP